MKDNTNIPIQTQPLDKDDVVKKWHESRISMTEEYDTGAVVIQVDGIPIGTLGNFSASIGKAKSKKTFNVSAMTAAALSARRYLRMRLVYQKARTRFFMSIPNRARHIVRRHLPGSLLLPTFPMVRTMTVWNFSPYGNTRLKNALKS